MQSIPRDVVTFASLRQAMTRITVDTTGRGTQDITSRVDQWLTQVGAADGLLTVFIRHTSASLVVTENTDPDVRHDLVDALDRLAPVNMPYRHDLEGLDDMPAHIKTALTSVSVAVPVVGGRMDFGTWQGLFVVEHRLRGHPRRLTLHYLGT